MTGTRLTFTVSTGLDRLPALDRRDEIVDALEALGLRVSMYAEGTLIFLADEGEPTIGDVLTGAATPADFAPPVMTVTVDGAGVRICGGEGCGHAAENHIRRARAGRPAVPGGCIVGGCRCRRVPAQCICEGRGGHTDPDCPFHEAGPGGTAAGSKGVWFDIEYYWTAVRDGNDAGARSGVWMAADSPRHRFREPGEQWCRTCGCAAAGWQHDLTGATPRPGR